LWTRVGGRMHKFNRIRQVAPLCLVEGHVAVTSNNIEPSVYGGSNVPSHEGTLVPLGEYD